MSNTGDSNTGDNNTGYGNTGDSNTGDWNTGSYETGAFNTIQADKINEIKEFAINSDSHDDDLYNMTVLCFNLIQQGAKNRIGGFQLKETYTSHKEAYTCYTNGIIDFSCNTDKAKDFHQYIKKKAKDISNATCKYMDSRRGSQRSNEGQESSR